VTDGGKHATGKATGTGRKQESVTRSEEEHEIETDREQVSDELRRRSSKSKGRRRPNVSDRRRSGVATAPITQENDRSLVRHEEEARVDKRWEGVGYARTRREVESGIARVEYPLQRDELGQERAPVRKNDSGKIETLPDRSISLRLSRRSSSSRS
jgi:hypothetical protein